MGEAKRKKEGRKKFIRQVEVLSELAEAIGKDSNARCTDELLAWPPQLRSEWIFLATHSWRDPNALLIARAILRDSEEGIGLVAEYPHALGLAEIEGVLAMPAAGIAFMQLSSFGLACLRRNTLDFVELFLEFGLDPSSIFDDEGRQSTFLEQAVWFSSMINAADLEAYGAVGPLIEMLVAAGGGARSIKVEEPMFPSAGDPFAAARLSNNNEALVALTSGYVAIEANAVGSSAGPGKRKGGENRIGPL